VQVVNISLAALDQRGWRFRVELRPSFGDGQATRTGAFADIVDVVAAAAT
jgi:hypothetical protein